MLSGDGSKCLLSRGAGVHNHRDSEHIGAFFGSVELNKSIEDTARHEVMTEVGLQLQQVTLLLSQPWQSQTGGCMELMIGCVARAQSMQGGSTPELQWLSLEEALAALATAASKDLGTGLIGEYSRQAITMAQTLVKCWADGFTFAEPQQTTLVST